MVMGGHVCTDKCADILIEEIRKRLLMLSPDRRLEAWPDNVCRRCGCDTGGICCGCHESKDYD